MLLLPCFLWGSALCSCSVLLSYSIISLPQPITSVLISTLKHILFLLLKTMQVITYVHLTVLVIMMMTLSEIPSQYHHKHTCLSMDLLSRVLLVLLETTSTAAELVLKLGQKVLFYGAMVDVVDWQTLRLVPISVLYCGPKECITLNRYVHDL